MKKTRHKWKYRINVKKKVLVLVILGVLLFVGMGYAIVNSNLSIGGTLEVSKYDNDKTLYGILKKEALRNGNALAYSGAHQDSMDSTKSTETIYHWYADSTNTGLEVLEQNNVVFADKCWKLIRTTDTGGVRIMYNGEADITDNGDGTYSYDCGTSRATHDGFDDYKVQNLYSNYYYASSYTYDASTSKYQLDYSNDTEPIYKKWSDSEYENLLGLYTCGSNQQNGTCTALMYVDSYYSNTSANVYTIKRNQEYHNIATKALGSEYTYTYVGYQYGYTGGTEGFLGASNLVFTSTNSHGVHERSFDFSKYDYYYADSYTWDVNNGYALDAPTTQLLPANGTSLVESDLQPMIGKYMIFYNKSNGNPATAGIIYVIDTYLSNRIKCVELLNGVSNSFTIGDGLESDGKTLSNPQTLTYRQWYNNYASYNNYFACGGFATTCDEPRYIVTTANNGYTYVQGQLLLANSREGLTLTDYDIVNKYEIYNNPSNYSNYKYTCGDTSVTCNAADLKELKVMLRDRYYFNFNHYFGSSVIWDGEKYILQNTIDLESIKNYNDISTHHFTCKDPGKTSCETVNYIYYYEYNNGPQFGINSFVLSNGELNVTDLLDDIYENDSDSILKTYVEGWYKKELLSYDQYIDDTIYCNDRSFATTGTNSFNASGLNYNGGSPQKTADFNSKVNQTDLSCSRTEDKFSVSNNDAKLKYKVAVPTIPDMALMGNANARKAKVPYWTMTPNYFSELAAHMFFIDGNGGAISQDRVNKKYGIVPVISLVSGLEYSSGTGRTDDPYIVDLS